MNANERMSEQGNIQPHRPQAALPPIDLCSFPSALRQSRPPSTAKGWGGMGTERSLRAHKTLVFCQCLHSQQSSPLAEGGDKREDLSLLPHRVLATPTGPAARPAYPSA